MSSEVLGLLISENAFGDRRKDSSPRTVTRLSGTDIVSVSTEVIEAYQQYRGWLGWTYDVQVSQAATSSPWAVGGDQDGSKNAVS